jgi:hypothetical protein
MILDKLFKKNKSETYFFEVDDNASKKAEAKPEETKTATVKEEQPEAAKVESTSTQSEATTEKSAPPATTATTTTADVSYDVPEWVKAIKNYSKPEASDSSTGNTGNNFAGKYISNNVPISRRRPGASLNKFKDIASEIKK